MVNYDARPNKTVDINLETTANYQSRSDLNIAFSTMDRETAFFKFNVTQDNSPLSISNANATTHIALKHEDGSFITGKLDVLDAMNGVLGYSLPAELLQRAGKVTGQVYIARHSKDLNQAIVAERIFTFRIDESLGYEIDSQTKLTYIIEVDELINEVKTRLQEFEATFNQMEEYVIKLNEAKVLGISDIELAKTNALKGINDLFTSKLNEINATKDESINTIQQLTQETQNKIDAFNTTVKPENYVMKSEYETIQNVKITDDTGELPLIDMPDMNNPDVYFNHSGMYFCTNVLNQPVGESSIGYVKFINRGVYAKLTYYPYNNDKSYHKTRKESSYESVEQPYIWSEFVDVTNDMETQTGAQIKVDTASDSLKNYIDAKFFDTGWQNLTLLSGITPDIEVGNCVYRVKNGVCSIIFHLKATSASGEIPMFTLPDNFLPGQGFSFLARTNGSTGKNPVKCSYDVVRKQFKFWQNNTNDIQEGEYIYGSLTYLTEV